MTFRNQLRFYGRLKVSVSCLARSIQFAQSKRIYHNHHSDHRARLNRRTHTTSALPLSLPAACAACMVFRRSRSIRPAMVQACISLSCRSAISLMILSASFRSIPPPHKIINSARSVISRASFAIAFLLSITSNSGVVSMFANPFPVIMQPSVSVGSLPK